MNTKCRQNHITFFIDFKTDEISQAMQLKAEKCMIPELDMTGLANMQ